MLVRQGLQRPKYFAHRMCIQSMGGIHQLLVSLVVCMSALSLGVAGSIYWLCTVAFWPASHSGGEHYSTQGYSFMMRARKARTSDDVVILDNRASRTYLSVFKWLQNPVPCNGSVTSANGVRSRSTHISHLANYLLCYIVLTWPLISYLSVT